MTATDILVFLEVGQINLTVCLYRFCVTTEWKRRVVPLFAELIVEIGTILVKVCLAGDSAVLVDHLGDHLRRLLFLKLLLDVPSTAAEDTWLLWDKVKLNTRDRTL